MHSQVYITIAIVIARCAAQGMAAPASWLERRLGRVKEGTATVPKQQLGASSRGGSLTGALQSIYFLNAGTVRAIDTYVNVPVACEYLEAENVTAAQSSWGVGGACPYPYLLVGPPPAPSSCNATAPMPGFDRGGGDYATVMQATDDATLCESTCCNATECDSWVYAPQAPAVFMSCTAGSHCCFLKNGQPTPTKSSLPGITSGTMNRATPDVAQPPIGVRSSVPLGGLGAGAMELRADGTFHEVTIMNQSPAGSAKFGVWADAMLGISASGTARAVRTHPPAYAAANGVDSITYSGSYPVSRLAIADAGLAAVGVSATVFAFSTLRPGDIPGSAFPAVVFSAVLSNTGTAASNASLLVQMPFGGVADCARPPSGAQGSTAVGVTDAQSCARACAAAPVSTCASWTFDGAATCSMVNAVAWSVYKPRSSCGVRGSWSAAGGQAAGLTFVQGGSPAAGSPADGDFTLLPLTDADGSSAAISFGVADTADALFADWSANGGFGAAPGVTTAPFTSALGLVGGASVSALVPAGDSVTVSIVLAWSFPHRDHMGEDIGNLYGTLWDSSSSVASALASTERLTSVVTDINAHHAVFASPASPLPDWLQDMALNQVRDPTLSPSSARLNPRLTLHTDEPLPRHDRHARRPPARVRGERLPRS